MAENLDNRTVLGFADEWVRFDQSELANDESRELFENYFKIFPWAELAPDAVGFDLGCGSGRWARHVAPRVGQLYCIDASGEVISVAKRNLIGFPNCVFQTASVDAIPLPDSSMDFGYSLGVLHHVPDTFQGIRSCVAKLKRGAPFLVYLYYSFDNRPHWFRLLWKISDLLRRIVSNCPGPLRYGFSQLISLIVYLPLARLSHALETLGWNVSCIPLSCYRDRSFYTMRTDALDRFGTVLERRFTSREIEHMMSEAGLERISFSDIPPFWCAVGYRRS